MKKISAIYIRVSTDAQREEGYSIEAQKEMLTAYCISKGIKDYDYYIDGGYSGSNIQRPELERLIADIKENKINCVLVYKLDRLSRSQKDTLFLIEDIFNPHNVDFVSLNESMDTSTPLGRLMLGILSAFAQLERENIRERTSMGMKERIKNGFWMGGGKVPFGYDYDAENGILVPNKDAETVKKVYDLYLSGYSTNAIARILNLKYERLARQILTRKTNAGFIVYKGEEFKGRHTPIISLETYEKAMRLMEARSNHRVTDAGYLLTGLVKCGYCGAKMRYQRWGKKGFKLVCYSKDKSKPHMVKDPDCPSSGLWASEIEGVVLDDLFSIGFESKEQNSNDEKNILEILKDNEKKLNEKLKRLYLLYAEDDNDALLETISDVKSNLKQAREQIKKEEKERAISKRNTDIKQRLETLPEAWEYMTLQEKRRIIEDCVSEITATDNDVKIYYKFM
ncbi:MAG: recombinase family protein [Clostridia bacterium]|nr:recombinase family protein [Clostridia bacterium]